MYIANCFSHFEAQKNKFLDLLGHENLKMCEKIKKMALKFIKSTCFGPISVTFPYSDFCHQTFVTPTFVIADFCHLDFFHTNPITQIFGGFGEKVIVTKVGVTTVG